MKNIILVKQKYPIREWLIYFLFENSKNIYRVFAKRNYEPWTLTVNNLLAFEENTLGKDLGLFLNKHNFNLEPKFEKHDIHHLLTGYEPNVIGEVCVSVFNLANGKRKLYTSVAAFFGVLIMFEEYKTFIEAYKRGKNARSYAKWKFEHLLNENTQELKKYIFKQENNLEVMI
ncbi:MAG: Coq4 family protein [Chitinophagales bacterium]